MRLYLVYQTLNIIFSVPTTKIQNLGKTRVWD
jgi:hypothetical protein